MLRTRRFLLIRTVAVVCLLASSGCGGKKTVNVTGKLVLPNNVKLEKTDAVQITFVPEDPKNLAGIAKLTPPDLAFVVKNSTGKGVSTGKYKIAVKITPYAGMPESEKRALSFEPINKFFAVSKSKLSYEVTQDAEQAVTVDLIKGTVTKN